MEATGPYIVSGISPEIENGYATARVARMRGFHSQIPPAPQAKLILAT
jgi:hypothetical protein